MNKILTLLNARIMVNDNNGKTEAVSALKELREAIMGPLMDMEKQAADTVGGILSNHSAQLYLNQRSLDMLLKLTEGYRK